MSILDKFGPLVQQLQQIQSQLPAKYRVGGGKHVGYTKASLAIRKAKRRRKGSAAKRARKLNRRATKRPKGRRKP